MYSIRCTVKHHGIVTLSDINESHYIILVDHPQITGSRQLAKEAIQEKYPLYDQSSFNFALGIQIIKGNLTKEKVKILFAGVN